MSDDKKPREFFVSTYLRFGTTFGPYMQAFEKRHPAMTDKDVVHVIEKSYADELEAKVAELEVKLKTMKHDYWFIENLIERYSTNKDETLKSILERVKFRKPLFKGVVG
jgi:hypothetical protein